MNLSLSLSLSLSVTGTTLWFLLGLSNNVPLPKLEGDCKTVPILKLKKTEKWSARANPAN